MPQARDRTVPPNCSGYYHCVSRCVRRAWLCGFDEVKQIDYEYRRQWVEYRLLTLAEAYSVSIYAYAVMSNHLHVVLKIDAVAAQEWSDDVVVRRWCLAFPGSADPEALKTRIANIAAAPEQVAKYRDRLRNLSWLMRSLVEPIARQANREDQCTGRFWKGRFKAQALLDERALLAAMVYADLNPVRAKIVRDLPSSEHTSAQRRGNEIETGARSAHEPLKPTAGIEQEGLSLSNFQYLLLAEETGRHWHHGNLGGISGDAQSILDQIKIQPKQWDDQVRGLGKRNVSAMGPLERLIDFAADTGRRWLAGYSLARKVYRRAILA